ncbi:nudC domain-containing protein 2-like [Cloeon dipterum]|uniref:nudC domain-containing protein 2-like n=1 Tax=Cloeon dipterum TaxID=197152 RepID=UPI00321FC16B
MAKEDLSFYDMKGGFAPVKTEFGRWWQTVYEIHLEVDLPPNTRGKECVVNITTTELSVQVRGETKLKGKLFGIIRPDESVWTVEENVMTILLSRSDHAINEIIWPSLMADKSYPLDAVAMHETRKKLDLERFQITNPGFDFTNARLAKCYDKVKELPKEEDE